ncbi:putative modification methylase [Pseudomonas savastanoi pv. nerii]|uniref:DNA cytosine methyltransferase n=1 Tax=Pseudomonas savastanoi TaxID=29438 RepID=UPI0006E4CB46|nr:DNA cytosine methyltransferase [Pseudomonas savastanoi]KPY12355.1 putative modification methylase [Pseudomonas savastanoi pv. nerii]
MQTSSAFPDKPNPQEKLLSKKSSNSDRPQIVSLFCGAGGLDLGFHEQGFQISLAIDISSAAIKTHKRNFPKTPSFAADLIKLGPEGVFNLVAENIPFGEKIGVIGGPPCQGFSRANTASYAKDPRNKLPNLYVQIVKKLQTQYQVEFVVFENVLGMRDKKHNQTYNTLIKSLSKLKFDITEKELCAIDFGVPQIRKRIILSALRKGAYGSVTPLKKEGHTTIKPLLHLLPEPAYFKRSMVPSDIPYHVNHWTMTPKSVRFLNPETPRPASRSFRRLSWDKPSPTVAYGNREIHIHPDGRRRLSIFEAMLLQGFPETFVLEGNFSQQVEQVSNAVPPPMGSSIARAVITAMECNQ